MRERFIEALKNRGAEEVPSRSGKYVTLTRPNANGLFFFVGESGGLRTGKTVSRSAPVQDAYKKRLLEEAP
jgi:hypothetical protein